MVSLSMNLIKYQSVFRLTDASTECDPKVVASVCSWKLQIVYSQGHSFTLAVRCPLRLGAGMRCWPNTADQWHSRAATPQGRFQRKPSASQHAGHCQAGHSAHGAPRSASAQLPCSVTVSVDSIWNAILSFLF